MPQTVKTYLQLTPGNDNFIIDIQNGTDDNNFKAISTFPVGASGFKDPNLQKGANYYRLLIKVGREKQW